MDLLVKSDLSIREALQKIDASGQKTLIVVDEEGVLLGTVSDGDIRRLILQENNLQKTIELIYNKKCIFFQGRYDLEGAKRIMLDKKITTIPIIDSKGKVVNVLLWSDLFQYRERSYEASVPVPSVVIMAGGKGVRLSPFTKILPKPLIPIENRTAIEVIMGEFCKFGVRDFYISLNYKSGIIKSYLNSLDLDYNITYVLEEEYLGTGGSLRLLPQNISDHFIVSNCDTFIKANFNDLYRYHLVNGNDVTVVGATQRVTIPYGVLNVDSEGRLKEIDEKPTYDFIINTGLYVVRKSVVRYVPEGMFHITDLISALLKKNKRVGVFPIADNSYLDVGQWDEYQKNISFLQEQSRAKHVG